MHHNILIIGPEITPSQYQYPDQEFCERCLGPADRTQQTQLPSRPQPLGKITIIVLWLWKHDNDGDCCGFLGCAISMSPSSAPLQCLLPSVAGTYCHSISEYTFRIFKI